METRNRTRQMRRTTSELVNPMTNPSFPFATLIAGFAVLLLWELWKLSNGDIPYVLGIPMSTLYFGGIWDNMRLYGGASIGPTAITHTSVSVSYLFRMAGFPIMYAALAEMASQLLENHWIGLIGNIAAVTFIVHGFNVFIVNIMGNYVLVYESGVPKYTVDPKKRTPAVFLPVVIIGMLSIIVSLIALATRSAIGPVFLQVLCFFFYSAAPVDEEHKLYVTHAVELVFGFSLFYLQALL